MLNIDENLLTKIPQDIAKEVMGGRTDENKTTSSQIRKFYDDFLVLQKKMHDVSFTEERFKNEILPLIKFAKAKMAYSVGKGVLPKIFMDKMVPYIEAIQTRKCFDNFILFYQAVIGYAKFAEFESKSQNQSGGRGNGGYNNNGRRN